MTKQTDTIDRVLVDMQARKQLGYDRYGVALNHLSDKDFLQEAYEEAMDLCVYLRAELDRRNEINHPR